MKPAENNFYSYTKYKKKIIKIYNDERRECYYLPTIKELLESICSFEKEVKVINVYDNKSSHGVHAESQGVYADKGGLQDLIITPVSYTYEKPTKPYVTIEVKIPDIVIIDAVITRYNKLKVKNHIEQLKEQFKKTSHIIFTDCITWYLLTKVENLKGKLNKGPEDCISIIELTLVEESQEIWVWKREMLKFSNKNKVFFKEIGLGCIVEDEEENEINPSFWNELIMILTEFIEKSKK